MPVAKSAGKAIFGDVLGNIVYAPVFWYSRGLTDAARYCWNQVVRQWKSLGVGVWIVNIFVPMYGQRDIAGVLISIFMRLIQIIVRAGAFLLYFALMVALFIAYLVGPIFILVELLRQLAGLFS
jgi:hypothetical protein